MSKQIDIKDQKFGKLTVIKYKGNQYWECKCECGGVKLATSRNLRYGITSHCGCEDKHAFIDLKDTKIGEWTVLEYAGNSYWKCRCSCGVEKEVHSYRLRNGESLSCGHVHGKKQDLTNQVFGELTALYYLGNRKWMCRCSCGKEYPVGTYDLTSGHSKSCGHATNRFKDLKDQKFDYLTPIEYLGKGYWRCKCECGNIKDIKGEHIRNRLIRSCGCMKEAIRQESMINKYGELCTWNEQSRTPEQIQVLHDKEKITSLVVRYFTNKSRPITPGELANMLGVKPCTALRAIHKFELESYVDLSKHTSIAETDLGKFIESFGYEVIYQDKKILNGKELDIYIPEKKLAIEFNGSYWHSTIFKDSKYHQDKTLECAKKGIHLIHIFEYEWLDEVKKAKVYNCIRSLLNSDITKIYARNTVVKIMDNADAKVFLDKYHLQNGINSSVSIGCYNKEDELLGVITFGIPRFDSKYQWEILRLCWKPNVKVIGGTSKMLNLFKRIYNPDSILTYADITKFTGNTYSRIGFKCNINSITLPNYVWVDTSTNKVLSRYQTQKHKLIEKNLDKYGNTEDEIMESLGYIKVYDSGNIKLEWFKQQ